MTSIYRLLAKNYKVISLDIFDTLISRNVRLPSDVFYMTGQKVLGNQFAESFRIDRIEAERIARKMSSSEITIQDIYSKLERKYKNFYQDLLSKEIEIEIRECHGIKRMIGFVNDIAKGNKRILLISDMYLPKSVIEQILYKCDVTNYEKLFLSNEYGCLKGDGKLFSCALKECNITNKEMIHFGDSIKADCIGASKAGVRFVLLHQKNRVKRVVSSRKKQYRHNKSM